MESAIKNKKGLSVKGLQQVKVDNWGTFFLQRLLQLYFNEDLLDFTIKFQTTENKLKVHKLVVTSCTDYFVQLEHEQLKNDPSARNMTIVPSDMPYECVKSIISFMYTGQLEYWTSELNALYYTAQKMKMSVLTKLLDAQLNTKVSESQDDDLSINESIILKDNEQMDSKNISTSLCTGRISEKKSSQSKRKVSDKLNFSNLKNNLESCNIHVGRKNVLQTIAGPSRFDLPDIEDVTLGVFSSFDDITYNTKPIVQAPENSTIDNKTSVTSIKINESNMLLKIASNVNCLQIENEDIESSEDEWMTLKPDLKSEKFHVSPFKKCRFEYGEKENFQKSDNEYAMSSNTDSTETVRNHAKIIREVLKNYPDLVQRNKNIRLKIMQKESKSDECTSSGKTKVSYVVLKSDSLMINNTIKSNSLSDVNYSLLDNNDSGPWKCTKCNLTKQYTVYCMYRSHMQDVHGEKFDPRICKYCGYKATKRNILMYHMYTKHNVPPPKSMSFPKCHVCSYVALSEPLLIRHLNNHKHESSKLISFLSKPDIKCSQCKEHFSDTTALIYHKIMTSHASSHNHKENINYCLYCGKQQANEFTMQVHIACHHKSAPEYLNAMSILSNQLPESENFRHLNNVIKSIRKQSSQHSTKKNENFDGDQTNIVPNYKNNMNNTIQQTNSVRNNKGNNHTLRNNIPLNVSMNNEHNVMKTYTSTDAQYLEHSNEIVEEVVEELEALEDEIHMVDSTCDETSKCQNIYNKEDNCDSPNGCLFISQNIHPNIHKIGEIITYVEEETEILEYETSNNLA